MIRRFAVLPIAVLSLLGFGQVALAGEWAPGLNDHIGSAGVAQSECVYNGHDDDDPEDDEIWARSPAGGRVQSGGQLIAIGFEGPGVQAEACNAHLNPLNP